MTENLLITYYYVSSLFRCFVIIYTCRVASIELVPINCVKTIPIDFDKNSADGVFKDLSPQ